MYTYFYFLHTQGLFHGILGPTLYDLEQLTGTTTAEISLMFTAMTVGALVGVPVCKREIKLCSALEFVKSVSCMLQSPGSEFQQCWVMTVP